VNAYENYLTSAAWRRLRYAALRRARWRCERCGAHVTNLDVHHRTYKRLGHERLDDLEVVCTTCHRYADAERRTRAWRTA
jgi:hypothetical protein